MKVFVLAPKENWICDRQLAEWNLHASNITTTSIEDCDIIWLLAGWCWNQVDPRILKNKKVVVTEHHIVPEKFNEQKLNSFKVRDALVDAYHVPNDTTASFLKKITNKPIYVIPYWYNPETWYYENKEKCRKELGLPSDKFIVGSFQRDTEGGTRNPKLEKGPDLFVDYLIKMNRDDLLVLLGGWRREYICDRLNDAKIPYTGVELAPLEVVRKMYASCDLYVVSSRYEGGPQAIYEASVMRVPIVSTDVGVARKILCDNCIVDIPNEVYYPTKEDIDLNFSKVKSYTIEVHKEEYFKMFGGVLS